MIRRRTEAGPAAGRQSERGAIIVEMVVIVPLLLTLVLGMMELGFRIRNNQSVVSGSRSAARVVSSAGDSRLADYDALQALAGSLDRFDSADIQRIIIYRSVTPDGAMPPGCDIAPQNGNCNHYDATDLTAPLSAFTGTSSCTVGSPDEPWCPLDRNAEQFPSADWIGVRVEVRHHSVAPFLSDTTIVDTTVMRLEPRFTS